MYRTPYLSEMKNFQLYGPKYNNFRANCTAVFVCVFFSISSGRNIAKYAFQYTFKKHQTIRKKEEEEKKDQSRETSRRYPQWVTNPVPNSAWQGLTWGALLKNLDFRDGKLRDTYF